MLSTKRMAVVVAVAVATLAASACAAELKVLLPLGRTAYQTNERIDVAVVRSAGEALKAGNLDLALMGDDGSCLAFTFAVGAAPVVDGKAVRTEHLYLDGRLLRPGPYTVEVACDGGTGKASVEVYSHLRGSTFCTLYWAQGNAAGPHQQWMGPAGLGFNLFWGQGGSWSEDLIRGGLDYMQCCTMSGGHQMDLRQECDWSDSYVLGGGVARVARQALIDRTRSNVTGVHFYDEPGLTWWKHPRTGQEVPHNIPSQDRSFLGAFGREAPQYDRIDPNDPASLAAWMHLGRWKEGFMDAAWKLARFGVEYVRPDYLSANQSMYGWNAFSDGYYFNVQRSMPVLCGHGGYDLWGPGYFHPSVTLAMGRVRDWAKPAWYLPTWSNETADRFRLQQYLSFMMNVQGMMTPPPIKMMKPWEEPTADGVVESNRLMSRLGTIFANTPVTRPPTAVLYSLSANLYDQARNMKRPHDEAGPFNYGHRQKAQMDVLYTAHGMVQHEFFPVVEEDVVDGTLAAHHKTLIVPTVFYLPPEVIGALEAFASAGGKVFLSDDSKVEIKGAVKLGVAIPAPMAEPDKLGPFLAACRPVAERLKAVYGECGIAPVFGCDSPTILAARQTAGDVEYLFAVNVACDEKRGGYNPIRPTVATIRLPADGRPVYDLTQPDYGPMQRGTSAAFEPQGRELVGRFRFGAGQMRVFARTDRPLVTPGAARPTTAVRLATPLVRADYTAAGAPLRVDLAATVVDDGGQLVGGSIPLEIRLTDPLGVARYCLYRATDGGTVRLSVPLAANDPVGEYTVSVRELLAGTSGEARFAYKPAAQCGAAAGSAQRAVFFGRDRENVFRFFRLHKDVTIVTGKADFHAAAAARLSRSLAPWGVRARTVAADDVNKPRALPEEAHKTWVGVDFGRLDAAKPAIGHTGFAIDGPVILLGTPEDNPLIKFLADKGYLPYEPAKDEFPGRGRGMIAWQRDGIGWFGQESIALIAYDADGLAEAVGTLYEAAAALDPLMKWEPPVVAGVTPAGKAPEQTPGAKVAWQVMLPDRAVAIRPLASDRAVVLAKDGTLLAFDANGKDVWRKEIDDGGEDWSLAVSDDGKAVTVGATHQRLTFTEAGKQASAEALAPSKEWKAPEPPKFPVGLPNRTVVAYAPMGEGAVVAMADAGAVLRLKSREGNPADQVVWEHKQPGRLAKTLAVGPAGNVAVAYWGGTVHVLDAGGKLKYAQDLPQDVADLAWVGGRLVVGVADGSVLAIDAR